MLQDPLNDAMVTMRNAEAAGKTDCVIRPASKLIGRVLKVMQEHEYIRSFELIEDGRGNVYRVGLVGSINNCGVIKPRFAVRRTDVALLIVGRRRLTGSSAALAIETLREGIEWAGPGPVPTRLARVRTTTRVLRSRRAASDWSPSLWWRA